MSKMRILWLFYIAGLLQLCCINLHSNNNSPAQSVLLLIDCSGSMKGAKMDSVKSASKQIINMLLQCNTEFAVMGFTGILDKPLPYQLNFTTNKKDLHYFINRLEAWGGTRIGSAFKASSIYFKEHLKSVPQSKPTIILLSDGRSDDDIFASLKELIDLKSVIPTECIAYDLTKDPEAANQLRQLSFATGGEYYQADDVPNVIKAFMKSGIKTIIREVPVEVRKRKKDFDFKPIPTESLNKLLTTQNWFLDSIQINAHDSIYAETLFITNENMQDTMPKSLVFDDSKKISLFVENGTRSEINKKWVEGNFYLTKDDITLTFLNYYFKLKIKYIDKKSMVLCVTKFKNVVDSTMGSDDELCDCKNKIRKGNPYIFAYFSRAGCN